MQRFITLLSLLLSYSCMYAGPVTDINNLVKKWDEAHNIFKLEELKTIFSTEVLFYGRKVRSAQIIAIKKSLLAEGFEQAITTPINIIYYSSGTIKCEFTKRTKIGAKIKEHLCYLLVKKINGKYLVTGEGDALTDQRKAIDLNLGSVIVSPTKKVALFVTIALIGLAGFWGWNFFKKKQHNRDDKQQISSNIDTTQNTVEPVLSDEKAIANLQEIFVQAPGPNQNDAFNWKEKGDNFEKYITQKFDRNIFKLLEWRGDKYYEGVYAMTNHLPDMEWELNTHGEKACFAVECKYRSKYDELGQITICNSHQLQNYHAYSKRRDIPVFIVLGVGGKPFSPDELFILPLKKVHLNIISRTFLQVYKKKKTAETFGYNKIINDLF